MTSIALAPSILSADFRHLAEQVADGHFVPNITIGPVVVRSLRRVTRLPLEAHLMIAEPDRYLEAFADAGADGLTNPDRVRPACELEVDGGIHPETARRVVDAGARILVAGSAVFEDAGGVRAGMQRLRASLAG